MIIKLEIIFFTYFVSIFFLLYFLASRSIIEWSVEKVSLMMNVFVVLYFDTNYVLCCICLSGCASLATV